jgi:hypothetical protein
MRLIRHLNEFDTASYDQINEMINVLKRDCAPYLKEARKFPKGKFLFRGAHSFRPNKNNALDAKKVRKGREPRDIPRLVHEYMDHEMKNMFGWRARSEGVFATSSFVTAADFGLPYLFFPAGRFSFVYGIEPDGKPISDVLGALDRADILIWRPNEYHVNPELLPHEGWKYKLDDFMKQFTNKDLKKGIEQGAEIMFNCKYYYLTEHDNGIELAKIIWG